MTSMLKLGFLFILVSLQAQASTPFLLVTDIDDTTKITNVKKLLPSIIHGLFGKREFAGMSTLYQNMIQSAADAGATDSTLYAVSGTTLILKPRVRAFLRSNDFPAAKIFTRGVIPSESTDTFKHSVVEAIAQDHVEPFILIGDDTEKDPEAYDLFYRAHPDRVLKIYIHRVTGRSVPASATLYTSAFDIAYQEARAGRLTPAQAIQVADEILAGDERLNRVMPRFVICPKTFVPSVASADPLEQARAAVDQKIQRACELRGN